MFVDYTDTQKALRKEFRAYFSNLITPEYREELRNAESGPLYKQLIRQQGKDGMLAVGWPEQYGGRGLSQSEQLIRFEEGPAGGGTYSLCDPEYRRPGHHEPRYRGTETAFSARYRRR